MKKIIIASGVASMLLLSACGSSETATPETKTADTTKKEETATQNNAVKPKEEAVQPKPDATKPKEEIRTIENGVIEKTVNGVTTYSNDKTYRYFKTATWKDNWKGLETEIVRIAIAKETPIKGKNLAIVNVKYRLHNTTDKKFTTYPHLARLVTSEGQQLEEASFRKGNLAGDIEKGVKQEGIAYYIVDKATVDKIKWVKLSWDASEPGDNGETKQYDIELKIPQ